MTYQQQLRRIAAYQHGIVTTGDADEIEIPAVALRKLAAHGALQKIGHGVYRFEEFRRTVGSAEAEAAAIVDDEALTSYHGFPSVTLKTALQQVRARIPNTRWNEAIRQAARRELLAPNEIKELLSVNSEEGADF